MLELLPTFRQQNSNISLFFLSRLWPGKEILLQITLLGSEPTSSLWVDEVKAYELGSAAEELEILGVQIE